LDDTEKLGGNGEVQVYFEGAVAVLDQIDTIDPVLLFCGRITLDDMKLSRVQRVVRRDGVLLPAFARNLPLYRKRLREIALANGFHKVRNICKTSTEERTERDTTTTSIKVIKKTPKKMRAPKGKSPCKRRPGSRKPLKELRGCPAIAAASASTLDTAVEPVAKKRQSLIVPLAQQQPRKKPAPTVSLPLIKERTKAFVVVDLSSSAKNIANILLPIG
jgi:hypothetical protein